MKGIPVKAVIAFFGAISTLGCAGEFDAGPDPGDAENTDENVAEAEEPLISTWYANDYNTRTVWARGPFSGTPRVRYTWRTAVTNACNLSEKGMVPAPSSEITYNVCASLGLTYKVFSGGINACVTSTSSPSPTPIFRYRWFDALATQINYRVIDQGINGAILNDSGWVPFNGNGCPR